MGSNDPAITENRLNMPQATTETDVASLKNHLAGEPLATKRRWRKNASSQWFRSPAGLVYRQITLDFHIDPVLNQSVGGPENFYMYQLGVMGTADLWLTDHLLTTGSLFQILPTTTTSLTTLILRRTRTYRACVPMCF